MNPPSWPCLSPERRALQAHGIPHTSRDRTIKVHTLSIHPFNTTPPLSPLSSQLFSWTFKLMDGRCTTSLLHISPLNSPPFPPFPLSSFSSQPLSWTYKLMDGRCTTSLLHISPLTFFPYFSPFLLSSLSYLSCATLVIPLVGPTS